MTRAELNHAAEFASAEREELMYEMWIMTGGPEKAETKEKIAAGLYLDDLQVNSEWRVLTKELVRDDMGDYRIIEAVVRRKDELKLIRWKPFNKGFMEKLDYGWGIFRPEQ